MKFLLLIFLFLTISACTANKDISPLTIKTPFFIETMRLDKDKKNSVYVEKTARLTAGSTLTLAAESMGEVAKIHVKEGQNIREGALLITLNDTVDTFELRKAQAENNLHVQDANIEVTKVSLDKALRDSEVAYDQAKRNYDTLVAKIPLEYDSLVNSNRKILDDLDNKYKIYLADLEKNIDQILYESDRILGLSTVFQYTNDSFEYQLGARAGSLKVASDYSFGQAQEALGTLRAKKEFKMTELTAKEDIARLENGYKLIGKHIDDMIYMHQNNVIGGGLTYALNDSWILQWNGFRTQVNGSEANFISWKSEVLTFLKNYELNQLATKLAIESLNRELTDSEKSTIEQSPDAKLIYDKSIIDLKDKIKTAESILKQAESSKLLVERNNKATLDQLLANRKGGEISLEQIVQDMPKLRIDAPFEGSVVKILGTEGQKVNVGTPLIEVTSQIPEVLIDLEDESARSLKVGDKLLVKVENKSFTGTISTISRVANTNLLYTTRISLPGAKEYLGSAVSVTLPSASGSPTTENKIILPLRMVNIISEQEGEIILLGSGNTLNYKTVALGKQGGEGIEILDSINPASEIIITDMTHFDRSKHFIKKSDENAAQ